MLVMGEQRDDIIEMIRRLPDAKLPQVRRALRRIETEELDPMIAAFETAPLDDEPVTPEDIAAIEEGVADIAQGDVYSLEALRKELLG